MIPDGLSLPQERLSNMDDTAGPDLADPRLRVVSAVLYLAGLALLVIGSVGAFLWSPVLWCAIVGLVLIAGAFVVAGGRFCPGAYGPAYRPARAAGLDADAPGATARPTGSTQTWQKPAIVGECPTHGEAR